MSESDQHSGPAGDDADREKARHRLIELLLRYEVLRFGDFELKSGRRSPYFFNLGQIADGVGLKALGEAYADAIVATDLLPDVLFGPAYKGIPLATAAAVALAEKYRFNCGVAYNRKEAKNHGEGGRLVGHPLEGRILIIDDVMTAGTAVNEAVDIIEQAGGESARLTGVMVAMDRQELLDNGQTALQQVAAARSIPVRSILSLQDLIDYLELQPAHREPLRQIRAYQEAHCLI
jgi:orotate phosphoribosyltransferase